MDAANDECGPHLHRCPTRAKYPLCPYGPTSIRIRRWSGRRGRQPRAVCWWMAVPGSTKRQPSVLQDQLPGLRPPVDLSEISRQPSLASPGNRHNVVYPGSDRAAQRQGAERRSSAMAASSGSTDCAISRPASSDNTSAHRYCCRAAPACRARRDIAQSPTAPTSSRCCFAALNETVRRAHLPDIAGPWCPSPNQPAWVHAIPLRKPSLWVPDRDMVDGVRRHRGHFGWVRGRMSIIAIVSTSRRRRRDAILLVVGTRCPATEALDLTLRPSGLT